MLPLNPAEYRKGVLFALGCYLIWGLFPIYWYPLNSMDPFQLMAQRVVWSALFLILLILIRKEQRILLTALKNPKVMLPFALSATLLGINWTLYLWAITHHRVLDASLGYYINPLVSIFLGRLFLKEVLTKRQYIAIIIAGIGVLWMALLGGAIPYVAIVLATSFGFYGLIKRLVTLPAIAGLTLETLFMLPFALTYLFIEAKAGRLQFATLSHLQLTLLLLSGVVTTIPLLLFAEGAKRIPLSLVGILQYLSPTLQFFTGVFLFQEHFDLNRFFGFLIVWIALSIFVQSEWQAMRKRRAKNLKKVEDLL